MLSREPKQENVAVRKSSSAVSIVSADAAFVGNIEIHSQLHIDGSLQGDITSNSRVYIGKSGNYTGKILALHVIISGTVSGTIHADTIEILQSAVVEAELAAEKVKIEQSASFVGSMANSINEN